MRELSFAGAAFSNPADEMTASLLVVPTGPFGERLSQADVQIADVDDGKILARTSSPPWRLSVPYGYYRVTVLAMEFYSTQRSVRFVRLNRPDSVIYVGSPMFLGDYFGVPGGLSVSGVVTGMPAKTPGHLWLKLSGVFLPDSWECPLTEGGQFSFSGLDMGAYQLTTFLGDKIMDSRTFEIDPKRLDTKITVPLKASDVR